MSRALKDFKNLMVREGQISKLWKTHSAGTRIAPPKSGEKDKKWQLRLDAGEVKDGKKRVYLQVNSQASNESLQKELQYEVTWSLMHLPLCQQPGQFLQ
ncbi:uncharacterized protein BJX67DRAFT_377619 [Aspergillus lucknowensis]|uniref:Uncharacterized protein n=1 Tax=Aspergillus lucknowensis TaxID=176173 RepID=A0ABR4M2N6_9EURO